MEISAQPATAAADLPIGVDLFASKKHPQLPRGVLGFADSAVAADLPIAVDLFASKKHPQLPRGVLGFADSSGKMMFSVDRQSSKSSILLDSDGKPLISVWRHQKGCWQGFKGSSVGDENLLLFRVKRTRNKFSRTEFEVFLTAEGGGNGIEDSDFKVKGCPFQKTCTIYRGNSIVAQSSLMYKLHQIYAGRSKFRVTLFPGSNHTGLLLSLLLIFLDGRK